MSLSSMIGEVSGTKSRLTKILGSGTVLSPDELASSSQAFVQESKVLIQQVSELVDAVQKEAQSKYADDEFEALRVRCGQLATLTVGYIKGCRTSLFTQESGSEKQQELMERANGAFDSMLDALLDDILEMADMPMLSKNAEEAYPAKMRAPTMKDQGTMEVDGFAEDYDPNTPPSLPPKPEGRKHALTIDSLSKTSGRKLLPRKSSTPAKFDRNSGYEDTDSPVVGKRPSQPTKMPKLAYFDAEEEDGKTPPKQVVSPRHSGAQKAFDALRRKSPRSGVNSRDEEKEEKRPKSPRFGLSTRNSSPIGSPKRGTVKKSPRLWGSSREIQYKADVTMKTKKIHKCVTAGDLEGVKKVLGKSQTSEINARDAKGNTPLDLAILKKHEVIALVLVASGANLISVDAEGRTPLVLAVQAGFFQICDLMMEKGADPNVRAKNGVCFLEFLLRTHPPDAGLNTLKEALARDAALDFSNKYGENILHMAASRGWRQGIQMLLKDHSDKLDINSTNRYGETCLHKAVRVGNLEITEFLLDQGVDATIRSSHGTTALDLSKSEEISVLLKKRTGVWLGAERKAGAGGGGNSKDEEEQQQFVLRGRGNTILDDLGASKKLRETVFTSMADFADLDEDMRNFRASGRFEKQQPRDSVFEAYEGAMYDIEVEGPEAAPPLVLAVDIEPYRTRYFPKRHFNYATNQWKGKKVAILSVLANPMGGSFEAMLQSDRGSETIMFKESDVQEGKKSNIQIKKMLETVYTPKTKWKEITDKHFTLELLGKEAAHSHNARCFRIGVIYSAPGQVDEEEMFKNKQGSPAFLSFLELLGDRIELSGWSGYPGGFNTDDDDAEDAQAETYYTSWRGLEIMFHVSTMTSPEQQRRLIGNDISLIYFQEETPFRASLRGNVNSVAAVVQPIEGSVSTYRLGCFKRGNVCSFLPRLPADSVMEADALREFLFYKMVNGALAAHKSPPLNTLYGRLYTSAMEDLLKKRL